MAERTLPNIGLKGGYVDGEDDWGDGMRENLLQLSVSVQATAKSKVSATPGSPVAGDVYLFSETHPTHANTLAVYDGPSGSEAWTYFTPEEGWLVYNTAEGYYEKFGGTSWAELATGGGGSSLPPLTGNAGKALFVKSDESGTEWLEAAAGGSSSSSFDVPDLIQVKYARVTATGGQTITLDTAPTVGNIMVLAWTGPGGDGPPDVPAGWTRLAVWAAGNDTNAWLGNAFQGAALYARPVESGDTGITIASKSGSPAENYALFEMERFDAFYFLSNRLPVNGSDFRYPFMRGHYGTGRHFAMVENDSAVTVTFDEPSGVAMLHQFGASSNHYAAIASVADTYEGDITGSFSGSPSYPVITCFGFAKYKASGGGGKPWHWKPPLAANFNPVGTIPPVLTDDADVGLLFDCGTAVTGDYIRAATTPLPDPSGDWVVTMRLAPILGLADYTQIGLGLFDASSATKCILHSYANNGNLYVQRWTVPSGYNGDAGVVGYRAPQGGPLWFRARRVVADAKIYFEVSVDGKIWAGITNVADTHHLGVEPTYVGPAAMTNCATPYRLGASVDYFDIS